MDISTSLNTAEVIQQRGFLLPALFTSASHLAFVNVCYDKEQSKLCPGQLRNGLNTFTRVHIIAKRNYLLRHFCLSVCLSFHSLGTTRLPLNGIFKKFDIWAFFENLSRKYKVIKITVKHNLNNYPDNRVSLLNVFLLWQHVSTVQAVIIRSKQKACYKSTMT
jgi:hypothetical protein